VRSALREVLGNTDVETGFDWTTTHGSIVGCACAREQTGWFGIVLSLDWLQPRQHSCDLYRPPLANASRRTDGTLVERLCDAFLARDACRPQLSDDRSKFSRYLIGAHYTGFRSGSLSRRCKTIWHGSSRLTAPRE
jgi:hypothetical protein